MMYLPLIVYSGELSPPRLLQRRLDIFASLKDCDMATHGTSLFEERPLEDRQRGAILNHVITQIL